MAKRGPRSQADLNVLPLDVSGSQQRLTPPASLTKPERLLFAELVATNPHLKSGDAHFLASYVMALAKANKIARKTDAASIKSWESTMRVVISMATKLRLTSQAQTYPKTSGRARANLSPPSYYDLMESGE